LQQRGILRYSEDLAPEIFAFQHEAYPAREPSLIEPRWRWMFLGSAARLGVEPMVWLYRSKDGVVAHQGAIAVELHTSAGTIVTGWFVETMVLEHVRGKTVGPMLVAKAREDLPVNLSLGQTEQMRQLQYRLGWHSVAGMDSWLLVLKPRRAFRGRVRNVLLRVAVAGAAWAWQRSARGVRRAMSPRRRLTRRLIERFASEYDQLWARLRDQYRCAIVRDASYLNWKYVEQPGLQFRRLELREDDQVRGVCVWTIHEPDANHAYRRGWVVDCLVGHDDTAAVTALLEGVAVDAVREGVDVLEFDLLSDGLAQLLRRTGWLRRGRTRQLLVCVHGVADDIAARMRSPRAWYLTRGDSDGDHPWWTAAGRRQDGQPFPPNDAAGGDTSVLR